MCGMCACHRRSGASFSIMETVPMFARLSFCMVLLLCLWHGAHGARMLRAGVQAVHELPPCKDVPGGIQNWDCYDAPSTPLPPCDFKHQNPGLDCSADPHPAATDIANESHIGATIDSAAASDKQSITGHPRHWPQPLPPCKDVLGGVLNQDCSDAPSTPLPPCDFKHQNPGIDCRINPPASKATTQLPDVASP